MAIDIGTVKGEEITVNKDGEDNVRLLQVELSNPDDLQTIEQMRQPGDDSPPQPGARVLVVDLGPSYRVAIAFDDGVEPSALPGEKYMYSHDDTYAVQASIYLEVDGTITISNSNGTIAIDASGNISLASGSGSASLTNSTGQWKVNDNFTVDV